MKEKKYTITCTEKQLHMIADAVEDWHRFLAGQCELSNATSLIQSTKDMHQCRELLDTQVRPYIVPELVSRGSSYSWDGGDCPNPYQRKAIAMSYGIYRQILHFFALKSNNGYNVYNSPTLTCTEQEGLIKIEEVI